MSAEHLTSTVYLSPGHDVSPVLPHARPDPPRRDPVLIVRQPMRADEIFSLADQQVVTVGRLDTRSIVLDDPYCSRNHCVLMLVDGDWFVWHRSRSNATQVNGLEVTAIARLQDGDAVRIGMTELIFWRGGVSPPATRPAT